MMKLNQVNLLQKEVRLKGIEKDNTIDKETIKGRITAMYSQVFIIFKFMFIIFLLFQFH